MLTSINSFPGLPCFCSSFCVDNNTWNRRTCENKVGLGAFIMWATSSGCREGGAQPQVSLCTVEWSCLQCLDFPLAVKRSHLADWTINWSKTARIDYGPCPPTSTSHPPDVSHMMNSPRSSTFFTALRLPCIMVNANWRANMGYAWERG